MARPHGTSRRDPATPTSRAVHGDRVWDHAGGPMQFPSSTWEH